MGDEFIPSDSSVLAMLTSPSESGDGPSSATRLIVPVILRGLPTNTEVTTAER